MTDTLEVNTTETVQAIETIQLGTLAVYGPNDVIQTASAMAVTLADVIRSRKLFVTISGRQYVKVEGWSTLGAMLGVLPREVEVTECENGDYLATVELIRASDGAIVGRASSLLSTDEKLWQDRPRYAQRSMAVTRATGKAFRLGFSWIMALAGYEPTPAEEMPTIVDSRPEPVTAKPPMSITTAENVTNSKDERYGDLGSETLTKMREALSSKLEDYNAPMALRKIYDYKIEAIDVILKARGA